MSVMSLINNRRSKACAYNILCAVRWTSTTASRRVSRSGSSLRLAVSAILKGSCMLFKSALVTQVSGSIGGMTGSRNRGGMYFRARSIPVNPNTPAQVVVRAAFSNLVARWNDILTPGQRDAWNLYAAAVPLTGPLGDPVTVSGQNMYLRSNVPRLRIGESIIDSAPDIFNLGVLSLVTFLTAIESTQILSFSLDPTDAWNVAGGFLILHQSRPLNPSINFFRGPYRLTGIGPGSGPTPTPLDVTPAFAFAADQRIFARAIASYPDGRLTEEQFLGPVLATAL